jgi:hypothetical protein
LQKYFFFKELPIVGWGQNLILMCRKTEYFLFAPFWDAVSSIHLQTVGSTSPACVRKQAGYILGY